ncbi:BQ2448_3217 [Microbotryum intermedium]|uniref:BQ2448_3217 protein n=1 Tax=Microbotryum intermedium TaxID=269621 RepID=A0A238FFQ2_9BASI|nr:BQ2448_3217 [Microbotryum intermedium]
MSAIDWSSFNLTAGDNAIGDDQDNYIAKLLSLDPNLPYSGPNLGMLSSPEASESASPESDAVPSSRQSSAGAPSIETSKAAAVPVKMSPTRAMAQAQHEKRKATDTKSSTAALKDRRASTTASGTASARGAEEAHHTHPDDDDNDNDSDDLDGKGSKEHKTTDKRKDQNRKAQRAFRERKEKHLKDLEDRVSSLEQESSEKAAENAALKQLMERLQNENERLKVFETAFSFSYAKDVSNSTTMSTAPQFKPPTPLTEQDELTRISAFTSPSSTSSAPLSETSSPFDTNGFITSNMPTPAPVFNTNPSAFALPQQGSYPLHASGSSSVSPLGFSPPMYDATNRQASLDEQLFLGSLPGASPASTHAGSSSASGASTHMTTPPGMSTADLFTAYRDSFGATDLTSLGEFDALFNTSDLSTGLSPAPGAPGTTSTPEDLLAAFVKSPSPVASASLSKAETSLPEGLTTSECPYVSPGAKYEFDVDGLCAEMKLKATCQEKAREALRSAMAADASAVAKAYPQQH